MSTPFLHFFEKINQISPLESDFTEVLRGIALMPKMLYLYGKMPKNMLKNRPKTVAIVGSRHNTRYGEEVAYKLAYELAKRGVIIVSGLAYGIDSIAHRGCLAASGTTIAVLGTPIDQIYPTRHLKLATEILEQGGAIISEYPPYCQNGPIHLDGTFGEIAVAPGQELPLEKFPLAPGENISKLGKRQLQRRASFLYRNRLISGLSDIVVVAEAASHSGSLNTASHALEQGKTVFAVPGNITAPYSQGCNRLITQGAIPYTEPDDILRELFPEDFVKNHHKLAKQNLIGDTIEETAILKALSAGLRSGEEIMRSAVLPPEIFNQTITMLEIKSRVRSLGANNWCLC